MFLAELYHHWLSEPSPISPHYRAVRLYRNAVGLTVFDKLLLLTPWVDFDLVDRWFGIRKVFQMSNTTFESAS